MYRLCLERGVIGDVPSPMVRKQPPHVPDAHELLATGGIVQRMQPSLEAGRRVPLRARSAVARTRRPLVGGCNVPRRSITLLQCWRREMVVDPSVSSVHYGIFNRFWSGWARTNAMLTLCVLGGDIARGPVQVRSASRALGQDFDSAPSPKAIDYACTEFTCRRRLKK